VNIERTTTTAPDGSFYCSMKFDGSAPLAMSFAWAWPLTTTPWSPL
jgi:hypothetical protein